MLGVQETHVLNKGGHSVRNPMDGLQGRTVTRVGTSLFRKRQSAFPLFCRLHNHCRER